MIRRFLVLSALLFLAACGGGGGGGGGGVAIPPAPPAAPPAPPPPPVTSNMATLTVDVGPAALAVGPNGFTQDNVAYVSVTLCAPGGATCQTIDHVSVDTGSVGLRIFQSVLDPALLAALPIQTDASANPVGECYGYVDGYVFGSVRHADFQIAGEAVANMPLQVIADTGVFSTPPASCSSGGGTNLNTVQSFGSNGIIGIGVATTDCGTFCATSGGFAAAIYYDCPSSGCASIIARAASTTAPFQQLPNPVAALSIDNNGTIISLPPAPAAGQASATGTLVFGIGTKANNSLGAATILTTSASGLLTAVYNGKSLNRSFVDSGSNLYVFVDTTLVACPNKVFVGYYCPLAPMMLSPTIRGLDGATADASFILYNAQTQLSTSNAVAPGVGGNPNLFSNLMAPSASFDFGLPFFYGRKIYTALSGRSAGGAVGPFVAF